MNDRLRRASAPLSLIALLCLGLSGCGASDATAPAAGDTEPAGPAPAATAATIEVSPTGRSISVGDTLRLSATARAADGKAVSTTISWSAGTPFASVDGAGLVVGLGAGVATITAKADGKEAVVTITVNPAGGTPPSSAPAVAPMALITRLPFDPSAVGGITPLGTLGSSTRGAPELGHPYGNERHFVWHRSPGTEYTVYSPVTAKIIAFRESTSNDFRVDLLLYQGADGKRVVTYLDHITTLDPALRAQIEARVEGGIRVTSSTVRVSPALEITAGTVLGRAGMTPVNWDWGIVDERTDAVARPASFYSDISKHARPVYDYATAEVQAQLRALSGQYNAQDGVLTARVGNPPMGTFTDDVAGTLSGIWFHRYDSEPYPQAAVINLSSLNSARLQFLLQIPDLALFGRYLNIELATSGTVNRRPAEVTAASGIVAYVLTNGSEDGVLYARVNADGTATLEAVRGSTTPNAGFQFTTGALTLRR